MTCLDSIRKRAAFTLVEMLTAIGIFGFFIAMVFGIWVSLGATSVNSTAYAERQNEQMRIMDYLKRDIRRAKRVEIYSGVNLVTDTTTFGTRLRLAMQDYYSDSGQEDGARSSTTNSPMLSSGDVAYGSEFTVQYSVLNGAAVRSEGSTQRTLGADVGAYAFSFKREADGTVLCRVFYNQPMLGGADRVLRREADIKVLPRSELRL